MSSAPQIELTLSFQDSQSPEKQEKFTQSLWQQMRQIEGVKVDRVTDKNPPEGSKAQTVMNISSVERIHLLNRFSKQEANECAIVLNRLV